MKTEINAHLSQITPRFYLEQGAPKSPETLEVQSAGEGAYTRAGAKQKLLFYRADGTNGMVVIESGKVVAHYTGNPGDYALYTYLVPADVNSDGLTDLLLFRNVEDGEDIDATLFTMAAAGPVFAGATAVFTPNASAGETPAPGVKADAYVVTVRPGASPVFQRESYQRESKGSWKLAKPLAEFSLQDSRQDGWEPRLMAVMSLDGVDEMKVEKALSKMTSYEDISSSIDAGPPRSEGERLVASNAALRLMELLDTRAAVYAVENATKQQVDHSASGKYALSLDGLTTVEAIRDAYIKHTNESLGGESPYAPTP